MKILWLDVDRASRLRDFYKPLREEVAQIADVTRITRPLDNERPVDLCKRATLDNRDMRPLVRHELTGKYDWIVCDAMYAFMSEKWSSMRCKKAVLWMDCHGRMVDVYMRRAFDCQFDLFCPQYLAGQRQFQPYLPDGKVYWLPWWIDPTIHHDYGARKQYGLLRTGAVHDNVYPFRASIDRACGGQPWYHTVEREKEGAGRSYRWANQDYARLLNSAEIALVGCSRYKYTLAKYTEIAGCKTAVLTDWCDDLAKLGFEPNVDCLVPDGDIVDFVRSWIASDKLKDIQQRGHDLVHAKHTAAVRARQLLAALRDAK